MRNHNNLPFPDGQEPDDEFFADEAEIQDIENWQPEELEEMATGVVGDMEYQEPDETSDEVLAQIATAIRHRMLKFGVEGLPPALNKDVILELWRQFDMSSHLLDDLVFFTLDHKQRTFGDPFAKVSFQDLLERADTVTDNPYRLRVKIAEDVVPNLVNLGFNRLQAYKEAQIGADDRTQAIRRLGWLAGQPYLRQALPEVIRSEEAAGRRLTVPRVLALATQEVKRQLDIHKSNEQRAKVRPNISYEHERYNQKGKTLQNVLNMCEIAFLGKGL